MKKSACFYLIATILFFLINLLISPKRIHAQNTNYSDPFIPTATSMDDEILAAQEQEAKDPKEKYVFAGRTEYMENTYALTSVNRWIYGPTKVVPSLNKNEQGGAIGVLAQAMDTIYANPPASAMAYTQDLLANSGLIPKAYAQGIGFSGLAPLLPLWKATRNIAYTVLIIIMVAIGFMIIFRMKIDPKTVISVQAALPKIILTLLLITFSYPIAGFLIDLMYLSMAIVIQLLAGAVPEEAAKQWGAGFLNDAATQQTEFITGGMGKLIISVFSFGMIPSFFQQTFMGSAGNSVGGGLSMILTGFFANALLATAGTAIAWPAVLIGLAGPAILILVIIGLGLLFTLIRLIMLLFNSYIQLLIAVILGPLLLLQEAIPGKSAFSEWIQNMIANLVVFPATVAVIYASWIFTTFAWKSNLWSAPLLSVGGGGSGGDIGGKGNPIAIFMGLGIIFLAPNLVASVKKAFHPKPALPVTAGTAFSPLTGGISTGMGAMQSFYYMNMSTQTGPLADIINAVKGKIGSRGGGGGGHAEG